MQGLLIFIVIILLIASLVGVGVMSYLLYKNRSNSKDALRYGALLLLALVILILCIVWLSTELAPSETFIWQVGGQADALKSGVVVRIQSHDANLFSRGTGFDYGQKLVKMFEGSRTCAGCGYQIKNAGDSASDTILRDGNIVTISNLARKDNKILTGAREDGNKEVHFASNCKGTPSCQLWKIRKMNRGDGYIRIDDLVSFESLRGTKEQKKEAYLSSPPKPADSTDVRVLPKKSCTDDRCMYWKLTNPVGVSKSANP